MKVADSDALDRVVARLVSALAPETVYLYGSHAYGRPHDDSDLDILVVLPEGVSNNSLPERSQEAYRSLRGLFLPIEVKVITSEEFQERSTWSSSIERTVKRKGRLLYDRETQRNQGVDGQGVGGLGIRADSAGA